VQRCLLIDEGETKAGAGGGSSAASGEAVAHGGSFLWGYAGSVVIDRQSQCVRACGQGEAHLTVHATVDGRVIEQVQEPETTTTSTANYGLFYSLSGVITAPNRARASGDTIILVVGEFPEVVMGGVILSVVGLWSATSLLERRVQAKMPRKKAKR